MNKKILKYLFKVYLFIRKKPSKNRIENSEKYKKAKNAFFYGSSRSFKLYGKPLSVLTLYKKG